MMRIVLFGRWPLAGFIATVFALSLLNGLAHEATLGAHEAALDPREAKALANARTLAAVTPASLAKAESCQLTVRLLDAETHKPLPGLLRVTQADGRAVPLAGLVNRGMK